MARQTLSVIVITLNEERNLRRCLESVRFADEIVVVDAGSTDATRDIACEFGAKVYHHKMGGFGAQKQFALEQATGDWILSLDADEWVPDALKGALMTFLQSPAASDGYDGYGIYRQNVYLGQSIRYCGWYRPLLLLFRRGKGRFNEKLVHESVVLDGPAGLLPGNILHVPYRDLFHHVEKISRYARLDAEEICKRGRKVYGWQAPIHLLLRPLWKFGEKYIWQQGFREGIHGMILSGMAAFGVFLIHAQGWLLQRERAQREGPKSGRGSPE